MMSGMDTAKTSALNQQIGNQTTPVANLGSVQKPIVIEENPVILISDNEEVMKEITQEIKPAAEEKNMQIEEETEIVLDSVSEKPAIAIADNMQNVVAEQKESMQEEIKPLTVNEDIVLQPNLENPVVECPEQTPNDQINVEVNPVENIEPEKVNEPEKENLPESGATQTMQVEEAEKVQDEHKVLVEEENKEETHGEDNKEAGHEEDNKETHEEKRAHEIRRKPPFKAAKARGFNFLFEDGRKVLRRLRNKFKKPEKSS